MLNKNNRDSLSITDNQATVNPTPSAVTLKACPWCCQPAGEGLSPAYTQQARYGACSHCGGLGEVLDGVGPILDDSYILEGFNFYVYVQGLRFEAKSLAEAAYIYNNETLSLAVAISKFQTEIPF